MRLGPPFLRPNPRGPGRPAVTLVAPEVREAAESELARLIDRIRFLAASISAARERLALAAASLGVAMSAKTAADLALLKRRIAVKTGGPADLAGAITNAEDAQTAEVAARAEVESIASEIVAAETEAATLAVRRFELVAILNPSPRI